VAVQWERNLKKKNPGEDYMQNLAGSWNDEAGVTVLTLDLGLQDMDQCKDTAAQE
jgi:hypothetical protein